MTDAEDLAVLARFIAAHGMTEKLLTEHEPDHEGRCRICRQGGDGSGRTVGCNLYRAAQAAEGGG